MGLFAAAAILLVAPTGLGFSGGICAGCPGAAAAPPGEFDQIGCVSCHGDSKKFAAVDNSVVTWQIRDADGNFLNGPYDPKATYTIHINFIEQVAINPPVTGNELPHHAGFNLRATAGKLAGVAGQSQANDAGSQATHVDPSRTNWNVTWAPPASGAVGFQLFVNDVDADGLNSIGDVPRQVFFGLTDSTGAALGAAPAKEEHHFGITLQQYWIGLIGLAGMIFVIVAGYVYLRYVTPHNTDQKDR